MTQGTQVTDIQVPPNCYLCHDGTFRLAPIPPGIMPSTATSKHRAAFVVESEWWTF